MGCWGWKWDGPIMGQVNGKSTIEKKTMTVTGVAVKKSDAGFDVDEYSVLSAGREEAREYPTWQWFDRCG